MGKRDDDDDARDARAGGSSSGPSSGQVKAIAWGIFLVIALVFFAKTFRIEEVRGDQVGFLVNNWTREVTEVRDAGKVVFCGLWNDFHTLDNRNLSLDMGAVAGQDEFVRLKTLDGNDIFVDFTIFYQMEPAKASLVLSENGPGDYYEKHWVRDYGRAIMRYVFGELSTEEFYSATKRDEKTAESLAEMNRLLEPHGVKVTQIAVQKFSFRKEYESKINDKKLADQDVQKFHSTLAANQQQQAREVEQAKREAENALTRFQGELDQKIEEVKGEADKKKREAEGYAKRVTLAAEASFHKVSNEALALRAQMEAEAAGVRALRDAMAGDGGRNLVAMEYAKKLNKLKIVGKPVLLEGAIQQFLHRQQDQDAASAKGGAK